MVSTDPLLIVRVPPGVTMTVDGTESPPGESGWVGPPIIDGAEGRGGSREGGIVGGGVVGGGEGGGEGGGDEAWTVQVYVCALYQGCCEVQSCVCEQ